MRVSTIHPNNFTRFMLCCPVLSLANSRFTIFVRISTLELRTGTQCQWGNPEEYGGIDDKNPLRNVDITTTKQNTTKLLFHGIYCDFMENWYMLWRNNLQANSHWYRDIHIPYVSATSWYRDPFPSSVEHFKKLKVSRTTSYISGYVIWNGFELKRSHRENKGLHHFMWLL